ncbi:MAG: hypothetical protein HFE91_01430 [Acutalibacter sp.]|uniref:hypothetical protein n=1 Tax=Acutalibacter sp. TaxID=1918636 RepID=UPI00216CF1A2|nr:hypothetical protein [Acutalibacter sp.]MCI9224112.1 hypothetical protein [Acutalibacter sp.]
MKQGAKQRKLMAFTAAIMIVVAAAAIAFWSDYQSARSSFPVWKEPEELPPAREEWLMEAGGSFEITQLSGEGLAWDRLSIWLKPSGEGNFGFYAAPVILDYKWCGWWYTVYEGEECYTVHSGDGGAVGVDLRFPSGIFHRDGRYRVRLGIKNSRQDGIYQVCSYEFKAKYRDGPAEGMEANDYDSWQEAREEDTDNGRITLTPRRTYTDGDGRAMLEFSVLFNEDSYSMGIDSRVDRLWQGRWYTVSGPDIQRGAATGGSGEPGQEFITAAAIPGKVLQHPGTYRLYWGHTYYCEFTVE